MGSKHRLELQQLFSNIIKAQARVKICRFSGSSIDESQFKSAKAKRAGELDMDRAVSVDARARLLRQSEVVLTICLLVHKEGSKARKHHTHVKHQAHEHIATWFSGYSRGDTPFFV